MTPKLARVVDPIFLYTLELLERIARRESVSPQEEQLRLRALIEQADALFGAEPEWDAAKYALVSWIDEVLLDTPWDGQDWWSNNILEVALFNSRLCNEKFYLRAAEFLTDPADPDKAPLYRRFRETFYRAFAEDMLVGGCTTALGVGGLLITPFKSAYLPDRLRSMPANTAAERQAKLLQAEDILRQCAEVEADGWGWMPHVLNLVVNIGAGLTTVLAFNRPWTDGLITFGESEAVSLLNIFTQPRKNLKALKGYEAKYKGGDSTGYGDGYDNEIFFTLVPGGVGIGMKF